MVTIHISVHVSLIYKIDDHTKILRRRSWHWNDSAKEGMALKKIVKNINYFNQLWCIFSLRHLYILAAKKKRKATEQKARMKLFFF